MKNYYDILGIDEDADKSKIHSAFKNLAKQHHPDRGGDAEKFKEINEAYDTLKNDNKKQEYDTLRKYGNLNEGGNFNFRSGNFDDIMSEDVFQDFFSGFGFGQRGRQRTYRRPRANKSIKVGISVSIKEILSKVERTISVNLPSGQNEIVSVTIPAGCQNGANFKYNGLGDNTDPNLPRGDLIVVVTVLDSDGYIRHGNDLHTEKTIDCFQAIRGCTIQLRLLDDNVIKVKVPAGTQPNTVMSVKGRGMPVHDTLNIRGNIYIKINVLIPQLSASDLKKIKDL